MKVYVQQQDGFKQIVGGGLIDGCMVDISHPVHPGESFCGVAYDALTAGDAYELNPETDTMSRVSE